MTTERNEDLLVGHDAIDAEHAELLRLCGVLRSSSGAGDDAAFAAALAQLWDAVVGHFATEDALMEEFAYPERAAHRTAHQLFVEDLKALAAEHAAHGRSDDVMAWATQRVPEWLSFHIQTNDAPLARFIGRRQASRLLANAMGEPAPAPKRRES
jgi:hemerythrin